MNHIHANDQRLKAQSLASKSDIHLYWPAGLGPQGRVFAHQHTWLFGAKLADISWFALIEGLTYIKPVGGTDSVLRAVLCDSSQHSTPVMCIP